MPRNSQEDLQRMIPRWHDVVYKSYEFRYWDRHAECWEDWRLSHSDMSVAAGRRIIDELTDCAGYVKKITHYTKTGLKVQYRLPKGNKNG